MAVTLATTGLDGDSLVIESPLSADLLAGCMSTSFEGSYAVKSGQTLRGNLLVTSGSVTLEENSRVTGMILLTSGELHIGKNA